MKYCERPGMKRALLAAGSILGIFTLLTAATLTDFANVNLGANGFAPAADYNIQVSVTQEDELGSVAWVEGESEAGVNLTNDEEFALEMQSMEPGEAKTFVIPVRNASEDWASTLSMNFKEVQSEAEAEEVDEPTLAAIEAFIKALELSYCVSDDPSTACDQDEEFEPAVSLTGEGTASTPVELIDDDDPLAPFEAADAAYDSGNGNATFVVVKVALNDATDLETVAGGSADIQVQFTGEAVEAA